MKNVFNKKFFYLFFGPFDEYNILILQRYCLQVNMSFVLCTETWKFRTRFHQTMTQFF